jgi:hypothetical protein
VGCGAGASGAGVVAQAASCSVSSTTGSRPELVTEPDTHDVNFGRS